MESSEEAPAEAEKAAKSMAPRKKYRSKRKNNPVEKRRMERVRKLKVACMSETELTNYLPGLKEKKNKRIKKRKSVPKSKYRSHYVKKTVKNTYKTLPRSPAERAEVLSKLAEQALIKLEAQASASKGDLLRQEMIKREVLESGNFEIQG